MIAERASGRTVTSTLQGEVIHMGIDQNAMAHIMNVLTDLYSNPLLAIIREYSTNAFDAMIEAGRASQLSNGLMTLTRPIEVSTPSPLSPFLRIKDSGVGLDAQGIREVYSQYGNSTKRATNDQVGMLGLGCKSALTYTDNFVVVSVKDGERVEVSIERNEDGAGVMKMPTVAQTNLPNGTEVIIPIKAGDTTRADQVARDFFKFWQPGTVLVNGQEPVRITGLDLNNDGRLLVIDGDTDYVIMGNVPYPVADPLRIVHNLPRGYRNNKSVAAFVGIGEVNFPPSREALMGTAKTKATLARIGQEAKQGLEKAVQREIQTAATAHEAVQAYVKWVGILGGNVRSGHYTWKGKNLPQTFVPARRFPITPRHSWQANADTAMLVTANDTYKLSAAESSDNLPVGEWDNSLFLYGYDLRAVTPTQKRKMRKYVEDKGLLSDGRPPIRNFVLIADKPDPDQMEWLGEKNVHPWADVNAIKLPSAYKSATSPYGRLPGSYDFYDLTGWNSGVSGDQIDQSKPIFYVHGRHGHAAQHAGVLRKYHSGGFYVVALSANRIDKFKRIIPSAKTAREGVVDLWKIESAKFTADQLLALHIYDEGVVRDLEGFDPAKVDDPDLKRAIRLASTDLKDVVSVRTQFESLVDTDTLNPVQWSNPLDKYPLWSAAHRGGRYGYTDTKNVAYSEDAYLYLNTKYALLNTTKGA